MNDETTYTDDIVTGENVTVTLTPVTPASPRTYSENKSAKANGVNGKDVRTWAKNNNLPVANKGRIHQSIVKAYVDANR